jgi:hypothetical protein
MIKKHNWQRHLETGHGIKLNIERRVTPDYSDVEFHINYQNRLKRKLVRLGLGFKFEKLPSDSDKLYELLNLVYSARK